MILRSPLFLAAALNKNIESLKLLKNLGANIHQKQHRGFNACDIAIMFNKNADMKILDILVNEWGIELNLEKRESLKGKTILDLADPKNVKEINDIYKKSQKLAVLQDPPSEKDMLNKNAQERLQKKDTFRRGQQLKKQESKKEPNSDSDNIPKTTIILGATTTIFGAISVGASIMAFKLKRDNNQLRQENQLLLLEAAPPPYEEKNALPRYERGRYERGR